MATETGEEPPSIGPQLPATEEAIALNPQLKVFVACDLYDSYATCASNEETWRNLHPELQKLIRFKYYPGELCFTLILKSDLRLVEM